jgi:PTH1 family peptidyl-tRNA hydrolase
VTQVKPKGTDEISLQLVVGLGNPGPQYANTRHNCGFMVVDRLAQRWGIPLVLEKRFQGSYGEGFALGGKRRLLKPETYMNRSGQSVRAVLDWYKLDLASVLVVYDDMDLPLGRLRLRGSGSAGGHNGMKSIIQHLGSEGVSAAAFGGGQTQGQPRCGRACVGGIRACRTRGAGAGVEYGGRGRGVLLARGTEDSHEPL